MFSSLYFFGKKENQTWRKDVLLDFMDNHTDVESVIEDFANINKDNSVFAWDGFVDEENEDWDLFF